MPHCDQLDIKGRLLIRMTDKAGNTIAERTVDNMIVNSGRLLVASLFAGLSGAAAVSHVAIGLDGSAPEPGQSKLLNFGLSKAIGEKTIQNNADGRVRVLFSVDFGANEPKGSVTFQEAGIFSGDPAAAIDKSVMYNRVSFAPLKKTKDYKLTLSWEITF